MDLDIPKTGMDENFTRSYYTSSGRYFLRLWWRRDCCRLCWQFSIGFDVVNYLTYVGRMVVPP